MSIDETEINQFNQFLAEHDEVSSLEEAVNLFRAEAKRQATANGTSPTALGDDLRRLRCEYVDSGGTLSTVDEINREVGAERKEQ